MGTRARSTKSAAAKKPATKPRKPAAATKPAPAKKVTGEPYVLIPKNGKPGEMLADPLKLDAPPLTTNAAAAKTLHGRGTVHKFMTRHPAIAKLFNAQRVA